MNVLTSFIGKYECFRTDYITPIEYKGYTYTSIDSAYHAGKCIERSQEFVNLSPSKAILLGHKVSLRQDWKDVKEELMHVLTLNKFLLNTDAKEVLLSTTGKTILYVNHYHNNVWGLCDCNECQFKDQQNKLGKILMQVREEIRRC